MKENWRWDGCNYTPLGPSDNTDEIFSELAEFCRTDLGVLHPLKTETRLLRDNPCIVRGSLEGCLDSGEIPMFLDSAALPHILKQTEC